MAQTFWMTMRAGMTLVVVLTGCATATPPSRMDRYVGTHPAPSLESLTPLSDRKGRTGLLVIADQTADGAAPVLPDEAQTRLTEQLKERFTQTLPLKVETLKPTERVQPDGDRGPLLELGKVHNVEYLLVVVASATEQEYPQTVFLGWHSHSQPGLRRDNWSLLEAALIDVQTGAVLLHGEGRSMATLDRPMAPGINQWYPVIWFRPAGPDGRPWWPPTYEGAPNTLRVVTMNEAAKRLVLDLQRTWLEFRHQELVLSRR
jgi:hypothetical protein